ncbi:tetratricopeptide repeat-containing sensor histidine kinase [Flavivirga jejuensis]|uniref:Tetratricopeptide repeat protein n=1 Tax=Flavivirga jejuensis TaxID=870487 RepID=A0ABT8WRR5_9FLAO|nr:tetratricopeptide repeat-containing sensor histidine kinase [Flavivirga jejuensis]MDO5975700.1 tetratricopeptide repeat protein [Flavivirga jejuensis]
MSKILIFSIVFLFLCCDNTKINSKTIDNGNTDINDYYKIAKNKNNSLQERYEAINKSFSLVKKGGRDTLFLKILYLKGVIHLSSKEYDSLFLYSKNLRKYAKRINNQSYLGKSNYLLGYYYDEITNLSDSSFYHYNISKTHFLNINDSSQVGKRLISMSLIQQNQSDFFGSKETITEALQYLHPKKDIKHIASSYNTLATNHRKLLNYNDAINFYKKAIKIILSKKDKLAYKNNLAATYTDNKQYKSAISILESIVKDSVVLNNEKKYARIIDNLAYVKWLSGQNETEKTLLEALNIRIKNNDKRGQIASYTHLGEFYSKNNRMKASAYFDSVIRLSKDLKMPKAEKDVVKFLIKLYPKNVELRDRYTILQDSLYAQELKVKTQFAKYKYDDKQKQESILRLQKEKAEKDLAYTKERQTKIIYLSAFILACITIAFAIYFFKRRAKILKQQNELEKLETIYSTEAELSRKLHDDFGAKINHSMLLVQNDSDKSKLLDTLDELYHQSRDFSREINEVETGVNYKNELFDMLSLYTSTQIKLYTTGSKSIDWSTINDLSKIVLYKVLRELMLNMLKHSNATAVKIAFKTLFDGLQINYSDNGKGASKMAMRNKNGLRNTEKRIQAIGGTIIFETDKGKGFKAEIKTPN